MGQEPAHNSKPLVWQSWAGFSTGLFCQGLIWCTQMDPEGGHCSSISWEPWSGDLEPKWSSQTIFRVVLAVEQHHLRPAFLYPVLVCPICCLRSCPQSSQSGASSSEGGRGTTVLLCQQSRFGWASATAAVPRQSRWEIPNLALLEERCSHFAHPGASQEESQNVLRWKGPNSVAVGHKITHRGHTAFPR